MDSIEEITWTSRIHWKEILTVTILWFLVCLLSPLVWNVDFPNAFWTKQAIFAAMLVTVYLFNKIVLVPKVLLPKGMFTYTIYVLVLSFITLMILRSVEHGLDLPRIMHEFFKPDKPYKKGSWFRFDFQGLLFILLSFGISTILILLDKEQHNAIKREELEKQKVSNELSFLKTQINPHFFFNTLNSIYSLTNFDIERAQEAIHTLSSMMRHVLYDSQKDVLPLQKEIMFIENYIQLMKLRLPKKVEVNYEDITKGANALIAPMIILPFVENAFKHGVSSQYPSVINIKIDYQAPNFHLFVENNVFEHVNKSLDESGIGLANTKRRLALIYSDKYKLDVDKSAERFVVDLKINMS
ncbi:sensor histidine kinase [Chondrinema litorale]|uniref:sensor histidine kinase n=1 Tax=Chondrinema litorale TaxID=2994555 RepID=UPI00254278B3|nr:sensor histidine kinase [Chondrinema litorale]UZR96641.1 sensor histidine kinase [Chondrinema litorale]